MAAADSGEGGNGSGEKTVTLVSSDGARFEVREDAASLSLTVRRMIAEAGGNAAAGGGGGVSIPLPDVDARTLSKVLEYCHKHARAPAPAPDLAVDPESSSAEAAAAADAEDLEWFDKEFMHVGMDTLYHLLRAADYLKVEGLLDLACKTVADMIKGKTPEQMRQIFGMENDFTPEEEAAARRENAWVFE